MVGELKGDMFGLLASLLIGDLGGFCLFSDGLKILTVVDHGTTSVGSFMLGWSV